MPTSNRAAVLHADKCGKRKILYTSYRQAKRMLIRRSKHEDDLRLYWCVPCGGYHITSQELWTGW